MIISISPSIVTEPKFLDAEILADEVSIDADARQVVVKVMEMAMLILDEEPADVAFATLQTKLIAAGFLCSYFKLHEPLKIRIMMTDDLESSFVAGPSNVIDIVEGKVKIDEILNARVQSFVKHRIPLQRLGGN